MTSEPAFIVRCGSCHPHGSSRPLEISELCRDCAETTADAHRSRGHHVEILTTTQTLQQRLHDPRTQRILRKVGW